MKTIFLYCFFFLPLLSQPQAINPYAKNYTVSDGLPSMECYQVIQDHSGYIWIATDRGVARFDGYGFTSFTTNDGLTDNVILHLFCDFKNRVWMAGLNGTICYAENGKILPYRFSSSLKKVFPQGGLVMGFFCDENDNLVFSISRLGILVIDAKGNVSIKIGQNPNYLGFLKTKSNIVVGGNGILYLKGIRGIVDGKEVEISYPENFTGYIGYRGAVLPSGSIVMPAETKLLFIDFNHLPPASYHCLDMPIFVYPESDSSVWISQFSSGGLSRLNWNRAKNTVRLMQQYFTDVIVSSMCDDASGGFWVTTLTNGLYYIPSISTKLLSRTNPLLSSKNITGMAQREDGTPLFSTENEIFLYRNDSVFFLPKQFQFLSGKPIQNILTSGNLLYVVISGGNVLVDLQRGTLLNRTIYYMNDFIADSSGLFITSSGCYQFNDTLAAEPSTMILNKRCDALLKSADGKIWVGSVDGLAFLDKNLSPHFINDPLLNGTRVKDMLQLPNGNFIIAGLGKGIIFWDGESAATLLDDPLNRELQLTNSIAADSSGVIWAGTNTGLYRISENETGKYEALKIGSSNGIPLTDVRKISVYAGKIFLLCHEGVLIYDPRKEKSILKPVAIYFGNIKSGNEIFSAAAISKIPYDKRDISIQFKGIDYSQFGKINYRYRLTGADTSWNYTTNTQIDFLKLPAGNYTLQAEAQNADSVWNLKPAQLSFFILKPWWQEYWFYLLLIFAVSSFAFLIARYRYKSRIKTEAQKRKSVELELAALRSQMNPHFIFNSLNAIQDFVFQHKAEEANEYLTKFARLMRAILNQTRKKFVTIEEEYELLQMYLELESLRFNQAFEWQIKLSSEIFLSEMLIPSMLLQPVIENSIKHGFRNLKRRGLLQISFGQENGFIVCEVEDNGMGRLAGNNNADANSHALSITQERLAILNQSLHRPCTMEVINLFDDGQPAGLKTVFRFPSNINQ